MRRPTRSACTVLMASVSVVALGCGEDGTSGPQAVANEWVQALDDGRWQDACDFQTAASTRCADDASRNYAGREIRLLPAGAFSDGPRVTDNQKRFALTAKKPEGSELTYFEVSQVAGQDRIANIISFVAL